MMEAGCSDGLLIADELQGGADEQASVGSGNQVHALAEREALQAWRAQIESRPTDRVPG